MRPFSFPLQICDVVVPHSQHGTLGILSQPDWGRASHARAHGHGGRQAAPAKLLFGMLVQDCKPLSSEHDTYNSQDQILALA